MRKKLNERRKSDEKVRFSIILPTYNRGYILKRAIESVLNQTLENWELIIVDDGSRDNTPQVVEEYLSRFKGKVKYVRYEENRGVNWARNRGIEVSEGEIITFLDSDDMFFPYTLERADEFIKKYSDYDAYWFMTINEKTGKIMGKVPYNGFAPSYEQILSMKYVSGEFLVFVKRHVFNHLSFPEYVKWSYEHLLWWQVAKNFKNIYSTYILRIYGVVGESITNPKRKYSPERLKNIEIALSRTLEIFGEDLKKYNPRGYLGEYNCFDESL